jgi:uridine kinase
MKSVGDYNFDHPNSLDFDLVYDFIKDLLKGKAVKIPRYSFVTNSR